MIVYGCVVVGAWCSRALSGTWGRDKGRFDNGEGFLFPEL